MPFEKGKSGNASGRPMNATAKIPSQKKIEQDILSGTSDAISKLKELLTHKEEKVRVKVANKIVDECIKLIKGNAKYRKGDVRNSLLENLLDAIRELKVLATTAENPMIQVAASSKILDKALEILAQRDAERLLAKTVGKEENKEKVVRMPVVSLKAVQ